MTMARNAGFYHAAGADDDQELALLRDTQAYLAQRAQGLTPLPHLATAWNRFYVRYDPMIRHHVGLRRLPEIDRSDCVQEVWLSVVTQLEHFRPDTGRARLGTWIGTIARNISIDFFRRRRRRSTEHSPSRWSQRSSPMNSAPPTCSSDTRRAPWFARCSTNSLIVYRRAPSGYFMPAGWRAAPSKRSRLPLNLTPEQVRSRHHRVIRAFHRFFEVVAKEGFPENGPQS